MEEEPSDTDECKECNEFKRTLRERINAFKVMSKVNPSLDSKILVETLEATLVAQDDDDPQHEEESPSNLPGPSRVMTHCSVAERVKIRQKIHTKVTSHPVQDKDVKKSKKIHRRGATRKKIEFSKLSKVKLRRLGQKFKKRKKKFVDYSKVIVRNPFENFDLKYTLSAHVRVERLTNVPQLASTSLKSESQESQIGVRATVEQVDRQIKKLRTSSGLQFQCRLCAMIFRLRKVICKHIRHIHFRERVKCQYCQETFYNNWTLHRHNQRRHAHVQEHAPAPAAESGQVLPCIVKSESQEILVPTPALPLSPDICQFGTIIKYEDAT